MSKCPICYENTVNMTTPCGHSYCTICISTWREFGHNTCPDCRTNLIAQNIPNTTVLVRHTRQQTNATYIISHTDIIVDIPYTILGDVVEHWPAEQQLPPQQEF